MKRKMVTIVAGLVSIVGLLAVAAPADAAAHRQRAGLAGISLGYTQVTVAPAVYQLVASAGITPAPVGGATAAPYKGTLAAKFPITGYDLRALRIKHSGGISLSAGSASITLRNFYIDLGRGYVSGEVSGSIGNVGRVDLFRIGLSSRLDLGLVRLSLTPTAAGALNATFGVNAFAGGDTFGYATPRPFSRF